MPSWLTGLLSLLFDAFLGWMKEQGRQEVRADIKEKTDATEAEFNRIDAAAPDPTGAFDRLRARTGAGVSVPRRE